MDIIREAVPIIVQAIPQHFSGVHPDVPLKIRVADVNAFVNDGDDNAARSRTCRPSLRSTDFL